MATYLERVQDYIGTFSDTAALDDWLSEGARIVTEKLKPEKLAIYATDKTDPDGTTGIALTGGRPLSAHKSGYEARLVSKGMSAAIADSSSIHYAIATDPVWYMDSTKGYVLPGGGTIKWFGYPAITNSNESTSNFPAEADATIALYAAMQGQIRNITDLVKTTLGGLAWSLSESLPAVASPSFTYTKPTFGGSYTDMETALTNQDIELAQGEGNQIALYLQEFNTDIQNELNEFNSAVQQYQSNLGEWNAAVANYQAEVNKEASRIQTVIQQYVSMYGGYFELLKSLREEFNRSLETL